MSGRPWRGTCTSSTALSRDRANLALLTFGPDGEKLAAAAVSDGPVIVWDTRAWRPEMTIDEATGEGNTPGFSPDGRLLDVDELVALAEQRVTRVLTAVECRTFDLSPCPTNGS